MGYDHIILFICSLQITESYFLNFSPDLKHLI